MHGVWRMSKQGQEERKELRCTDYFEQLAEVFNIQVTTDTKDIQPQQLVSPAG